jgi:RNase H-fold protein (predicted Holliday junction resolvase)
MHRTIEIRPARIAGCLAAVMLLAGAPAFAAGDPPPEVSKDGLQLVKKTDQRLVYMKPGATFSQYDKVMILDCYVEFAKNWEKDFNDSAVGLQDRVSDQDVQRMKTELAAEFKKVFTDELQNKGGYQVVDTAAPDVLLLRPALINVKVNAPDLMTPGVVATVANSAGQMTLYLELWDSATSTILARVMDAEADRGGFAQVSNSVTNKVAADRILQSWAEDLRKRLDAVRATPAGS